MPSTLEKLDPALYQWAIDSTLRGLPDADVVAGILKQTGLVFNPGTVGHWRERERVKFGGDRRWPPPPLPAKPIEPSATERIMQLTGRVADLLGEPRPQTWSEAERIAAMQRTPPDVEMLLSVSDLQGLWVDPAVMQTRSQVLRTFQPGTIAYLGDVFDFYSLSRFKKSPELLETMDPADEAAVINGYLDEDVKLSPRSKLWMKDGNHEWHLEGYMQENAPALRKLGTELTVPAILKLNERRAEYRRYKGANSQPFDWHGLQLQHGTFASKIVGGNSNTAKAMRQWPGTSGVIGHSHRAEVSYHMSRGQLWQWYNGGCCCRVTPGMEYMEGSPDNWAQAMVAAWWIENRLHIQLAILQDHCAVMGGWYFTPDGAWRL